MFQKEIMPKSNPFTIKVALILTNLNGSIRKSKAYTFDSDEITEILKRLRNKSGTFYNDKSIWDAICRAE